ncbi:MAG: phage holin family protein [Lachnospiraceae bacterium]|nr:phage holin family protein [Lachnospiraceae bacterium]
MDINFLLDYINLVTLGICLCVGFALKHAKLFEWLGNQYIPLIMLILGTIINVLISWPELNGTVILGGMISGLASTGLHEMLRNLLDKGKKEDPDLEE